MAAATAKEHGLVFSIQRFSVDDGDGIRTCIFLKGCPLRCQWCHNPESLSSRPEIAFYAGNCIDCGNCAVQCPENAILPDRTSRIDRSKCRVCGQCADVCCSEALVRIGEEMTVETVMDTVLRDLPFYGKEGGITITGGEPMLQPAFTLALAEAARRAGITVAIETSGWGNPEDFRRLLPFCDLFLFDCKASAERHKMLTGVEDHRILQNLDLLCTGGSRVILRCPIVEGGNLEAAFIRKITVLASRYPEITAVQLMPYHKTGLSKSATLGKLTQPEFRTPESVLLAQIAAYISRNSGKPVLC